LLVSWRRPQNRRDGGSPMFGMRRREFIALLGLRAREPGVHQATMYFSVNPLPLELAA